MHLAVTVAVASLACPIRILRVGAVRCVTVLVVRMLEIDVAEWVHLDVLLDGNPDLLRNTTHAFCEAFSGLCGTRMPVSRRDRTAGTGNELRM